MKKIIEYEKDIIFKTKIGEICSISLENEFEQAKAQHKYSVLKAKMMAYYSTVDMCKINLPDFLREDNPEKMADKELKNILCAPEGLKKFNELY